MSGTSTNKIKYLYKVFFFIVFISLFIYLYFSYLFIHLFILYLHAFSLVL